MKNRLSTKVRARLSQSYQKRYDENPELQKLVWQLVGIDRILVGYAMEIAEEIVKAEKEESEE